MPQDLQTMKGNTKKPFAGKCREKKHTKDRGLGAGECGSVSECLPKETPGSQHCTKHKPGTEAQHTGAAPERSKQEDPKFKVISYRHSQSQPSLGMRPCLKKKTKGYKVQNIFIL